MNMGYNDNHSQSTLLTSFKFAIQGIFGPITKERNYRIHLVATLLVVLLSIYFKITAIEWLAVILTIGAVLSLELVNFAVERTVDLVTDDKYHVLAKQAKDAAAGAVLIMAIVAVIVGCIIFIPYIFNEWGSLW